MSNAGNVSKIEIFVALFNALRLADQHKAESENKHFLMDESYIDQKIEEIAGQYNLSETDREELKNFIKSTYDFYQDEGEALLSNYNHVNWYPEEGKTRPYWERYYEWLKAKNPEFGSENSKFNFNTDAITNLLGNPNSDDPFQVRGLVMGDVQSGKTGTYIGLICKAVDAGYKVVILLTGMTENLRIQTQRRVNEGFVGYDSENFCQVGVGVDSSLIIPRSMTSTQTDYKGKNINQNTATAISRFDNNPLILVCKKNVTVLKKVIQGLSALNTTAARKKIDAPLLLIDDEADNASINTNKPEYDPTKINHSIRVLLSLFRQASYVGFTATPFANVFIQPTNPDEMEKDDLFPRDFIYSLKAPDNYIGPSSVFSMDGKYRHCLVYLRDYVQNKDFFSYGHKKNWDGDKLFPSFYEAIITFCLANAIRDIRGDTTTHRSMLINMSRFVAVQKRITVIAKEYLDDVRKTAKIFGGTKDSVAMANPMMREIHRVFELHYQGKCGVEWSKIKRALYKAIKSIKIATVNSKGADKLDYEGNKATGLRVIAVGGLALSRGLTLEGLIVSYFFRNTSTYDVLMQMGRWFGYRPKYGDLMRIWITESSARWYGEIAEAIEVMRKDITTMIARRKTPIEFGIRVRNDSDDLGITASNKMRNTVDRVERSSFYGTVFENTFVNKDVDDNERNWAAVDRLSLSLPAPDPGVKKPYYRDIPVQSILELLEEIVVPKVSLQFDREQLLNFIKTSNDPILSKWDVLIMTKDADDDEEERDGAEINLPKDKTIEVTLANGLKINTILRKCVALLDSVAISGGKSHIGSRDTKYGLTQEQLEQAKQERIDEGLSGTSQKMYLVKGRNPLLIIYAIRPKIFDFSDGPEVAYENFQLIMDTSLGHGCFVGFSIGIPRNGQEGGESHIYKVNRDADYYKKAGFNVEEEEDEDL